MHLLMLLSNYIAAPSFFVVLVLVMVAVYLFSSAHDIFKVEVDLLRRDFAAKNNMLRSHEVLYV